MRTIGSLNDIPKELKAKITTLKPGQFAEYQILQCSSIQDPDTKQIQKFYERREIYVKGQISFNGEVVDIGVSKRSDAKTKEILEYERVNWDNPRDGVLYLDGNVAIQREIDEVMQIMNECENSVLETERDPSIVPVFKRINREAEAKSKNLKRNMKRDALAFIDTMKNSEIIEFLAARNMSYSGSPEENINLIGDYADKFPEEFTKIIEAGTYQKSAVIAMAFADGSILFDANKYQVLRRNKSVIAALERPTDPKTTHVEAFEAWLSSAPNGDKVFEEIKKSRKQAVTV